MGAECTDKLDQAAAFQQDYNGMVKDLRNNFFLQNKKKSVEFVDNIVLDRLAQIPIRG